MPARILSLWIVVWPTCAAAAVDLVEDGRPVAEIVIPETPTPSVRVAAEELQRHIAEMSGATLPIVSRVSTEVKNQVYVGESPLARQLGVTLDDVAHDGFKIVARGNWVVLRSMGNLVIRR